MEPGRAPEVAFNATPAAIISDTATSVVTRVPADPPAGQSPSPPQRAPVPPSTAREILTRQPEQLRVPGEPASCSAGACRPAGTLGQPNELISVGDLVARDSALPRRPPPGHRPHPQPISRALTWPAQVRNVTAKPDVTTRPAGT